MQLHDPQLRFARTLIGHWLHIRAGALVPLEEQIDLRELLHVFDNLAIANLTQPAEVNIELAGRGVYRRYGRDIRRVNWLHLVPPTLGDAAERARESIRKAPCGFYFKVAVARDGAPVATAETLVLPLRTVIVAEPHEVIAITREGGAPPAGWLTPSAHLASLFNGLVDIGAGVPRED